MATSGFILLAALRKMVERTWEGEGKGGLGLKSGLRSRSPRASKSPRWRSRRRRGACDDRWCAEAASFLKSSTSWISKQALLQVLALVLAHELRVRVPRPRCDACAARRAATIEIDHPPGEEMEWDWLELPDAPWGGDAHLLVATLPYSGKARACFADDGRGPAPAGYLSA